MKYILIGLLSAQASLASINSTQSHPVDFESGTGMFFGRGYDVISADTKGDCVEIKNFTYEPNDINHGIYSQHFDMQLIENIDDLAKSMGMSASASLSGVFGNGSASMQYLESQRINRYSIFVLVKEEIITYMKNASNPIIKTGFLDKLNRNKSAFRDSCGDEYVTSMVYGGSYLGLIRFDTTDEESQKSLKISLSANIGSFSSAASFQNSLIQISKVKNLKITTFIKGGIATNEPTNVEEFLNQLIEFPKQVVQSSVPIKAQTSNYATIENFPIQQNLVETSIQEEAMSYLGKKRLEMIRMRNDIQYIHENMDQFNGVNWAALQTTENQINENMNKIDRITRECFNDLNKCIYPNDLSVPSFDLPGRKRGVQKSDCYKTADPVCGYIYHEDRTSHCKVETYQNLRQEKCGIETYKVKRSKACGAESFNEKRDPICGTEIFKICSHPKCGYLSSRNRDLEAGILYKQCRIQECGPELSASCSNEAFGVKEYKECEDPSHGVDLYKSCESNIPATYEICRAEEHGIQGVNECMVRSIVDAENNHISLEKCE